MKIAYIPPLALLPIALKSDYHLMLPQLTVFQSYETMYRFLCKQPQQHVILDNGAAEGELMSSSALLKIANDFQPDELVIPDVMGDSGASIRLAREFVYEWLDTGSNVAIGLVAAGPDIDSAIRTVNTVLDDYYDEISTIFIPRSLVKAHKLDARLIVAEAVSEFNKPIHFLGAAPFYPQEISNAAESELVRGLDTSAPFNFAYYGRHIDSSNTCERPGSYFSRHIGLFDAPVLSHNIRQIEVWADA